MNLPSEFLSDINDSLLHFESRDGSVRQGHSGNKKGTVSLLGWDDEHDDVVYI